MSAILHTNVRGEGVTIGSYSSNALFKSCNFKYMLEKKKGLKRKDNSAALKYGRALENALQFLHENGLNAESASDVFKAEWLKCKDDTTLRFTKTEGDWFSLYHAGSQAIRLYAVVLPTLPIKDPVFQLNYKRELFPGSELAGIQFQGFVDMVIRADWVHDMLPKVSIPPGSTYRSVLLDIKTSGVGLNIDSALLALDPQLLVYGWLSGISDIGFLWFQKSLPKSYRSGTEFTVLELSGKWTPGDKGVVLEYDEEKETVLAGTEENITKVKETLAEIKGKGSTERKTAQITEFIYSDILSYIHIDYITKQKLFFKVVRVNQEDIIEAGKTVAQTTAEIYQANQTDTWLKNPSIRFPDAKCTFCSHRGVCLREPRLVEELLVQITNPADDEWLDGVGEEEE